MSDTLPRVFWMAGWYRVLITLSSIAIVIAGAFFAVNALEAWQRIGGIASVVLGIAAFIDGMVSRIILDHDTLRVISLVRRRDYPRSDFESARVDGAAVCLKKRDGGWVVLPGTGHNTTSVRNTVEAWIKTGDT